MQVCQSHKQKIAAAPALPAKMQLFRSAFGPVQQQLDVTRTHVGRPAGLLSHTKRAAPPKGGAAQHRKLFTLWLRSGSLLRRLPFIRAFCNPRQGPLVPRFSPGRGLLIESAKGEATADSRAVTCRSKRAGSRKQQTNVSAH